MAKGRGKKSTLTKIDPDTLEPRPYGVSQHGIGGGKRVITTINFTQQPVATLPEPVAFDADSSNFSEDCLDGDDDEEASRGFYVTRVSNLLVLLSL